MTGEELHPDTLSECTAAGMCGIEKEWAMQEAINPVADIKTESNQRHNEGQELVAGSLWSVKIEQLPRPHTPSAPCLSPA